MLNDSDRHIFAAMADVIIPSWRRLPAASAVGVERAPLDAVLRSRPDLVDGVIAAIAICRDRTPSEGVNDLFQADKAAFDAFTLAATGAYYMDPGVRSLIGYPGQESPPYDPMATPDYLVDGLLERVTRRGAIYKSTPR